MTKMFSFSVRYGHFSASILQNCGKQQEGVRHGETERGEGRVHVLPDTRRSTVEQPAHPHPFETQNRPFFADATTVFCFRSSANHFRSESHPHQFSLRKVATAGLSHDNERQDETRQDNDQRQNKTRQQGKTIKSKEQDENKFDDTRQRSRKMKPRKTRQYKARLEQGSAGLL